MEKQYLDYEGFEHTIERLRRKEMPTASVDYVGQIVQYVGSTNSSYTKGYYYECVSDGETPATYSWVQRDIQPKEENISFVTPEQFGAVGDGVTDDSQAIDDALTAALDKKIPIKFAHKTYLVNSFRFPNNIIMFGDNATLLGGSDLANIEHSNRHDIYVKGITFDFSKRIKLQGSASTQCANITFEDCVFKGAEQTALQFQWVSDITLRNCKFDNCGAELTDPNTYGRAVNIVGQTNDSDTVFMKNIIIDGCEFSGTYGNKSISIGNGWISGIDIRNCYFHDTTYGGIEFYNWHTKTNGYINVVHDCVFERIGAAPMATGDPNIDTSSSGVGCCALYLKNSSSEAIATRNIFKYCVENAIEGPWQEISYNVIDTTGVMQDTRPTPSIEGIYLNGTQQSVHHNAIKRTGRTAIIATNQNAPGITDLKIFSNIIKDSNQYEGWPDTDDIRCTMFASGLTLRDNSYDNNFFLNLDSSNGPMEKFYWNQPRLFVSSRALHFKNGVVDIDGEKSRKDGWELSDTVTRDDESHYLLPKNAQMTYKFELNRFDGVRAHLIAKVKYSMQDIIGTGNVLRISIDTDTSHPSSSVLNIKGKYASAASEASPTPDEIVYNTIANPTGNPLEQGWYENTGTSQTPVYTLTSDTTVISGKTYYQKKEYYTDYAILNTDNTDSEILTAQIKNVSANTGNLEIVDVDFKVPYGIAIKNYSDKRYNVLDYGLKGDNSTDNSDAFDALLAELPRYGTAVIYFPQGRYRFSRPIIINDSNGITGVTLIGDTVVGKAYNDGTNNGCPDSTLIYTGDANTTFIKGGSNCWYFNVHGLHLSCKDGFNMSVNDAAFSEIPYNVLVSSVVKDNIVGLGKSNGMDVSNCAFSGFSGSGVETAVHTTVKDCSFNKCKIGVDAQYDTIINDCWFNNCGTAIVAERAGSSSSQDWSTLIMNDTWIDQCTRGIYCPAAQITMWLVGIMFDMFDEAAILCNGKIISSLIIGHIQRAGMKYADLEDSDRTTALAPETDAIVASQILNTKINIVSRRRTIGKGNHSSGMCPSRLVTATTISSSSISNQGFIYERIYDPDMVTLSNTAIYAGDRNNNDTNGMYKVYSGNYDSVEGEFYDADGNALPKVDKQQYYDIATRTTWIYYSAWSGFFRLFNDVVGMESSQMLSPLMTQYYPELNTARFRCMNVSGNDGGLIEGFIYKLDRVSVTPETGDSPADEGWWEVDSTTGKMIQTTDTEVVSGKFYFDYVWTQVKPQQSVFPGTLDEWNALTEAEKAKYDFIASPEEASTTKVVNRGHFNIEYTTLSVEVSQTVTFSQAMPNADYVIIIEPLGVNTSWRISNKTVNGFTITGIKNSGSTGVVQYKYTAFTVD